MKKKTYRKVIRLRKGVLKGIAEGIAVITIIFGALAINNNMRNNAIEKCIASGQNEFVCVNGLR